MINIRPQIPRFVWWIACFIALAWLISQLNFLPKAQFATNLNPSTICTSQQTSSAYSITTNQGVFGNHSIYLPNVTPFSIQEIQITPDTQCQSAIQPDRTYFVEFDIYLEAINYGTISNLIEWNPQSFNYNCTSVNTSGTCVNAWIGSNTGTPISHTFTNLEIRLNSIQGSINQPASSTSHYFNVLTVDYSVASSDSNGVMVLKVKGVARPTNSGATTFVLDAGEAGQPMLLMNRQLNSPATQIFIANFSSLRIVDYMASYEYQSMLALEDIATAIRDIPPGSGFDVVINRLEEQTQKDESWRQEERDWRQEERDWQRDTNTQDQANQVGNWLNEYEEEYPPGIVDIITAPLNLLNGLLTAGCVQPEIPIPWSQGGKLTLPCMRQIYQNHFSGVLLMYDGIALFVIAYWILVRYLQWLKIFRHPKNDTIEVFDL